MFSSEYCKSVKNSFFYRAPLVAASEFFKKLVENSWEENHFSLEFSSKISPYYFLVLAAAFLKITPLQVFCDFLSFFKHARDIPRTQSDIMMEPL